MSQAGTTQRVLQDLRHRILIGQLLPGEQLRQERLANELSISRVPLREALLILANEGLLTHQPNQGFVITKRSPAELEQMYRLLVILENELLGDTWQWPNRTTLMQLRNLNKRMAMLVDAQDWIDIVHLNHEFHLLLWRLSPLNLIVSELERVWRLADAYIAQSYSTPYHRAAVVTEHEAILEALTQRDLKKLRTAHDAHRESSHQSFNASQYRLA